MITTPDAARRDVDTLLLEAFQLRDAVTNVRFIPIRGKLKHIIVVQLSSPESRSLILKGKKSLAGTPRFKSIYIDRDLTTLETEIANKIKEKAKVIKNTGAKVGFTTNRIFIDNIMYQWNERAQDFVQSVQSSSNGDTTGNPSAAIQLLNQKNY